MSLSDRLKVLILDPSLGLFRVPAFGPLPQCLEDDMICFCKGSLARHVSMIVRPASDHRIELRDQVPGGGLRVRFDEASNFSQE